MIDLTSSNLGSVTSSFGWRTSPTSGASSDHKGVDIVLKDYNVPAVQSGLVTESAYNSKRGYYVTLYHRDGTSTRYQHLQNASTLKVGDTVTEGQTIGTMGSTGVSTGDHLHLEVFDASGEYLNPVSYMSGGSTSWLDNLNPLNNIGENVESALAIIIKFLAYLVLAVLAAFLFFKAFDIKII